MVRDIVCGIDVEEHVACGHGLYSRFDGLTYYFCCDECMQLFEQNPSQFVDPAIDVEFPEAISNPTPNLGLSGAASASHAGSRSRRRARPKSQGERKHAHEH